jgi:hypothetical protein
MIPIINSAKSVTGYDHLNIHDRIHAPIIVMATSAIDMLNILYE